ncbi:Hypothetical predicted protein [Marmota monax]|uniref:Uncharacterized protein n=1 Tax=Marmota monax TaxID=9995 RepID=A0A5E4CWU7_MARMO|nr:hypothetical protein GHT09_002304 [Marmota monax]VTJ86276.1 Hypothetical predicted protein [Marmota monax]
MSRSRPVPGQRARPAARVRRHPPPGKVTSPGPGPARAPLPPPGGLRSPPRWRGCVLLRLRRPLCYPGRPRQPLNTRVGRVLPSAPPTPPAHPAPLRSAPGVGSALRPPARSARRDGGSRFLAAERWRSGRAAAPRAAYGTDGPRSGLDVSSFSSNSNVLE